MKKLLATLLILCAGPVWAGWLAVTGVSEDGTQYFIDPTTIKGTHTKKFWAYTNKGSKSKSDGQSRRDFLQITCDDDEFRLVQGSTFSGKDLTGELLDSFDQGSSWTPIPPDTPIARYKTLVCEGK